MVVLGCVLAALAVVLLLVGALAWTRHLPGHKYVGIKVPEVRESREVWDAVHQFAGPLWLASGVAMAVAAVPPFSGVSWLLIISLVGVAASVYFFGLGSSMGARAAGVLVREESSGGCCGGDSSLPPRLILMRYDVRLVPPTRNRLRGIMTGARIFKL